MKNKNLMNDIDGDIQENFQEMDNLILKITSKNT